MCDSVNRNHTASSFCQNCTPAPGCSWRFSGWGKLSMHWLDGQSALSGARAHAADRQQCAITFVSSVLQAPAPRPQKVKIDQKPLPEAFAENPVQSLHLRTLCTSSCPVAPLHWKRQAAVALWTCLPFLVAGSKQLSLFPPIQPRATPRMESFICTEA